MIYFAFYCSKCCCSVPVKVKVPKLVEDPLLQIITLAPSCILDWMWNTVQHDQPVFPVTCQDVWLLTASFHVSFSLPQAD